MPRGSSPYFCAFSPDSQQIASVTNRGEVQIWNATTGKMQHVFRESESCVYAVAFSPTTAGLLVTTNGSKVNIQDITAGRLKATLDPMLGCTVQGVTFSADGTKLAAAIGNHVGIWDVPSFERTLIPAGFEITPVRYVQFGTNSNFLLSLSNSRVTVWTMEDGRNVRKADLDENSQINATSLSPNGMYVALAIHSRLRIRNTGQSNTGGEMSLEWNEEITSLAFSPDGTLLTVAMLIGDFKILQHPWTDDPVQTLRGHDRPVSRLSFSASGHYLVPCAMYDTSRIWIVDHDTPNYEAGHLDAITCIELSLDGRYLVSASHDKSLCLWDRNQGTFKCKKEHDNSIAFTIQFSNDGNRLVTGAKDGVVRLWVIFNSTLTCTHRFAEYSKSVRAAIFAPGDKWIASGSDDTTISLWNVTNLDSKPIVLEGHKAFVNCVAFSTDGALLASGGDGYGQQVQVWQRREENEVELLHALTGRRCSVMAVAFTPDSSQLISYFLDKQLVLWDISTGPCTMIVETSTCFHTLQVIPDAPCGSKRSSGPFRFLPPVPRIRICHSSGATKFRGLEGHCWLNMKREPYFSFPRDTSLMGTKEQPSSKETKS